MSAPTLSGISNNFFTAAQRGFATTLSSSCTSADTTLSMQSLAGYTTNDSVFLWLEPSSSNAELVFGIVNTGTNQLTGVVRGIIGSAAVHANSSAVAQYVSSADHMAMRKGMLVQHKQDGTHTGITTDTITVTSGSTLPAGDIGTNDLAALAVTGAKVAAGAITPDKLLSGASSSWAWQSWTPTWTGISLLNSTVSAKYVQVGKFVRFRITVTLAGGDKPSGNTTFTLPVTANSNQISGPDSLHVVGQAELQDAGSFTYIGQTRLYQSTTICQIYSCNSAGTYVAPEGLSATAPFAWGNGDGFTATGTYEAA